MPTPPKNPLTPDEIARFQTEQGSRYATVAPPATTHKILFSMEVEAGGLNALLKNPSALASIPNIERKLSEFVKAPPPDIKSQGYFFTLDEKSNGKTLVTYWYRTAWPPASPRR